MGQCKIIDNLEDGFYRVEIIKDTALADKRKKDLEAQKSALEDDITQLEIKESEQAQYITDLSFELNILIDTFILDQSDANRKAVDQATIFLQNENAIYQSILSDIEFKRLILAQKEKTIAELKNTLIKDIRSIWCADLSDDLIVGQLYGTLELNRSKEQILLQPAGAQQANKLQPTQSSGPMTTAYNLMILPALQRDRAKYRSGVISLIDSANNTCTVQLLPALSSQQDIDINKQSVYVNVPIKYMDCDSDAFNVDDKVIVYFDNAAGEALSPVVIGFFDHPAECALSRFIFYAKTDLPGYTLSIKTRKEDTEKKPAFENAIYGDDRLWGNTDWKGKFGHKDTVITWKGPGSRYPAAISGSWLPGQVLHAYKESSVYRDLKVIKRQKFSYSTVGAGYNGTNLNVFYFKDGVLSVETTDIDGELIYAGTVLSGVKRLIQIVAISADGAKAVTIISKEGDNYDRPLSSYPVESYITYVIDIDINNGFDITEKRQTLNVTSDSRRWYMYVEMIDAYDIAVDYKDNERVKFDWIQQGKDYDAPYFIIGAGGYSVQPKSIDQVFSSWFFSESFHEEWYTYNAFTSAEEFRILGLDLRLGLIVYKVETIESGYPLYYTLSQSRKVFLIKNGIKKDLNNDLSFSYNENSSPWPHGPYGDYHKPWALDNNFNMPLTYQQCAISVDRFGNSCVIYKRYNSEEFDLIFFTKEGSEKAVSIQDNGILTADYFRVDNTSYVIPVSGVI